MEIRQPKGNSLYAEQSPCQIACRFHRVPALLDSALHQSQNTRPIDLIGAFESEWAGLLQARFARSDGNVTHFVHASASGPSKHLQEFIRPDLVYFFPRSVFPVRHEDRAHGEIDTSSETHCGNHDTELPGLCQWFNQTSPLCIIQSTVVKGHPCTQQLFQTVSRKALLLGGQDNRVFFGEHPGNLKGEVFRCFSPRGKGK